MRKIFFPLFFLFLSTGCDVEYWWTRGQPPSVSTLYNRAQSRLEETLTAPTTNRPDIQPAVTTVKASINDVVKSLNGLDTDKPASGSPALAQALEKAKQDFYGLEGKLSIGSRAPYGELAGQLRGFAESANGTAPFDRKAFGLFSARVYFFLANELTVPPPNFG